MFLNYQLIVCNMSTIIPATVKPSLYFSTTMSSYSRSIESYSTSIESSHPYPSNDNYTISTGIL